MKENLNKYVLLRLGFQKDIICLSKNKNWFERNKYRTGLPVASFPAASNTITIHQQ